jgi:hypothetical protein
MATAPTETAQFPELMSFIDIAQDAQVIVDDESYTILEGLNIAIQKAVKKSFKYTKKTTVTLELKFIPGQMNEMEIDALVTTKEPKPTPRTMLAYVDSKARLHREDPNQTKLPLDRTVKMERNHDA